MPQKNGYLFLFHFPVLGRMIDGATSFDGIIQITGQDLTGKRRYTQTGLLREFL